jgi:hypothetical protein
VTTAKDVAAMLRGFAPEVRATVEALRALVKATVPGVAEKAQIAWKGFNYDHEGGLIAIAGHASWATLGFMRGVELDDPEHRLIGTGKTMRSVRVADREAVRDPYLVALIRQATALNERLGAPSGVGRAWGGGKPTKRGRTGSTRR